MEVLSKQEVADLLGVHIRAICYHIKKGNLNPIKVKGRLYSIQNKHYKLPERYNNHIKTIFLKEDVLQFVNN